MKKIFITATDTDAGKTHIAQALIIALTKNNYKVAAYKPVSAGCSVINGELINEDAQLLYQRANCDQTLQQVNPIAYEEPIAPHIAAQRLNNKIDLSDVNNSFKDLCKLGADVIVTEGAGGWRLPLGNGKYLSDFAKETEQSVVMVVNMKLGCLNHAVLTYDTIINDGLECIGWVANCFEEMSYLEENISELEGLIASPRLATINNDPNVERAANAINTSLLF